MEEYFVQKCVTADAPPAPPDSVSAWSAVHRCECVMVQENAHANGASRAVLASIVEMTTASKKTHRVALFTLEPALCSAFDAMASEKLDAIDFSADWPSLEAGLTDGHGAPLLTKMQDRLEHCLVNSSDGNTATCSARPNVVVVDSLNVLLETYPLARVLTWLRRLRRDPRIGSVVFRLNASALLTSENASVVVQSLVHETTAVVQVETPSSLSAYPILAKERRREIPKRMHGMVLLLRKKKNGRTSESVEYFHVSNGRVAYSADGEAVTAAGSGGGLNHSKVSVPNAPGAVPSRATASQPPQHAATLGSGKALPVSADEVSFNLSISAEEEAAKRNVELPYMHQGDAVNNLLFIDEDDPDWDDDDLDDDLDI